VATATVAGLTAAPPALAVVAPTNDSPPAVSGPARWGATLTSTNGGWSSLTPIEEYERQWYRCSTTSSCTPIPYAIGTGYTLTGAEVGSLIRVRVRARNAVGWSEPAYSSFTARVVTDPPDNASPPRFFGEARQGEVLTRSSYGSWSNPTPTSYSRQWLRCDASGGSCAAIAGAIGDAYELSADDVGKAIRLRVRAAGPYGNAEALSDPSAVVVQKAAPAPRSPSTQPRPKRLRPFPKIIVAGRLSSRGALFRQVVVRGPRNVTVRVSCRGRGCPYRKRSYRMRRRRLRIRALERAFGGGAVIVLRVVKRGRIGKYTRIRIRRGRIPARTDRCLVPGSSRPRSCR
jgi:hypothetical protein